MSGTYVSLMALSFRGVQSGEIAVLTRHSPEASLKGRHSGGTMFAEPAAIAAVCAAAAQPLQLLAQHRAGKALSTSEWCQKDTGRTVRRV